MKTARTLLEVNDLKVTVNSKGSAPLRIVDGVDIALGTSECMVVIGESGSGKSTLLKALLRAVPGKDVDVGGRIQLGDTDLAQLNEQEMRGVRGKRLALIAQNALAALDPLFTVGDQLGYLLRRHRGMDRKNAQQEAVALLAKVGIPHPEARYTSYPHELSGGMRQRVVIAMALACEPDLLLADEPTTALDVVTQLEVLRLLLELRRGMGMGLLFVTHDIGVAASIADRVVVMYAGEVVEQGPAATVLGNPQHPYTQGLVAANRPPQSGERWRSIPGEPPSLNALPPGCRFAPRCPEAGDRCRMERPSPGALEGRQVACFARTSTTAVEPLHAARAAS